MAITIKIATVDKSTLIDWESVTKQEVLTKEPDTLEFLIRNVPSKTYRPSIGDDVQMLDGVTVIFGGVIVETKEEVRGLVRYFYVLVKDYTEVLDRTLVSKSYASMTAAAIISDLITTYAPTFTVVNVVAPVTVTSITFNYMSISQCLQKLCESLQGYDWYPDYTKDIHFSLTSSVAAPFGLTDTNGNYVFGSLEYKASANQLRNSITVRGGLVPGTAVDNLQVADGSQRIYFVGYNLSSFLAYKALQATPTTFVALTVGKDGIDDPASFNALYNPDRGLLTFPDATKPAFGDVVKYTGTPYFPLIVTTQDTTSVGLYGAYQYLIIDKTITTKQAARDRASGELLLYANPVVSGSFTTHTSGLMQGQTITIQSTLRGISGSYKIQRVTTRLRTPSASTSDLSFDVEFVSTTELTMVDVLNKLLIKDPSDQITIGANEVVNRVYAFTETITVSELSAATKNKGTVFVLGPYTPTPDMATDTKRVFILNGSRLG